MLSLERVAHSIDCTMVRRYLNLIAMLTFHAVDQTIHSPHHSICQLDSENAKSMSIKLRNSNANSQPQVSACVRVF